MADVNRMTHKLQEALQQASAIATRRNHQGIDVEHLLAALLDQEGGLASSLLDAAGAPARALREGVERAIEYARAVRCPRLNCLAGIAAKDVARERLQETFVANLTYAASQLKAAGIRLLIEPINTIDIPGFFLNRTEQAAQIVADVGSHNLFIQYDIYHMQIMEGDVIRTIRENHQYIAHYHTGGVPGRN